MNIFLILQDYSSTLKIRIEIEDDKKILEMMMDSCRQENDQKSVFLLCDGKIIFNTETEKTGNIFSITDEILKCYELIKEIDDLDYS